MECTESRSRLQAYLDQELDAASAVAVERHLASCAGCKAILARQAALQSGIRRHAEYYAAPAPLAERIRARIGAGAQAPAGMRPPSIAWLAVPPWLRLGAAAAFVAVVSWTAAIQYAGPDRDEVVARQVISGHARAVLASRLVDVASSDQHTVKPWLSGRLDFSPSVTDLTGAGFPLVGGRLDYLEHRPVATLVYRHRQHMIDLFVWPEQRPGRAAPVRNVSRHGYNVLHWSEGGMAYWAISDLNLADMKAFADSFRAVRQ